MDFNWVDYSIIGILGFSVLVGLLRGFVREVLSLTSWILAFWISFTFSGDVARLLETDISSPVLRIVIAVAVLFIVSFIIMTIISMLITKILEKMRLRGTDKTLGVIFGFGRGILLVTLLLLLGNVIWVAQTSWLQASILVP